MLNIKSQYKIFTYKSDWYTPDSPGGRHLNALRSKIEKDIPCIRSFLYSLSTGGG